MRLAHLSLLVVIASSSACGGGNPVSGGVSFSRAGTVTAIHPNVCLGTSSSVSASEDGGNAVVVTVGDGSTGFRPNQPLSPSLVVIEMGASRTSITRDNCPNMAGSLTLTPTGERTATVSGTVHLECPSVEGAIVVGDLTFEACEVRP